MAKIEAGLTDVQGIDTPLKIAYQNAWGKLTKYYKLSDNTQTIYAAATIISPMGRARYFNVNWDSMPYEKEAMFKKVRLHFETYYADGCDTQYSIPLTNRWFSKKANLIDAQLGVNSEGPKSGDVYNDYIEGTPLHVERKHADLLNWWATRGPPQLRTMAFDLLSIPATSAEIERVFSSCKQIVTPRRYSLSDDTLEVLQTLRYWWKSETTGDIEVIELGDNETEEEE